MNDGRCYPKIQIYVDGQYVGCTNKVKSPQDAVKKFKADHTVMTIEDGIMVKKIIDKAHSSVTAAWA